MPDNSLLDHVNGGQFKRAPNPLHADGVERPVPAENRDRWSSVLDVPVEHLRSSQQTVDPDKVKALRKKRVADLDPIDVVCDPGTGLLVVDDGNHRAVAARAKGAKTIPARVRWVQGLDRR